MIPEKPTHSKNRSSPPSKPLPTRLLFEPSADTPEIRRSSQQWQKTPFSEKIYDFERALATFTVFFLFFWGAFIGFSLAGIRISNNLLNFFSAFLLSIDQGFIFFGFLSLFPYDQLVLFSMIIGWTAASIYARIKFGRLYYLRSIMYAGIFQLTMTIGLFVVILFPFLVTIILFLPSSLTGIVLFLILVGVYSVIVPIVFGLLGVFIGAIIQNEVPYHPIIRLVPSFLLSPFGQLYHTSSQKSKKEEMSGYCPFRMKQQPGCRFLGLRAANLPLICDDPRAWMNYCTLYSHLSEKIGGKTIES